MKVFLIGFMGAGKTTLGKEVAERLGWVFLDLDELIEQREGREVRQIFAEEGQEVFRRKEREALEATGDLAGSYIIACGGGTPCFGNNMDLIHQLGSSVYLRSSPEELARRLSPHKAHRPIISHLSDEELLSFIQDLLAQREPFYLQAQYVLQSDDPTAEDLPFL